VEADVGGGTARVGAAAAVAGAGVGVDIDDGGGAVVAEVVVGPDDVGGGGEDEGGGVMGADVLGASDVAGGTTRLVAAGTILLVDEHAAMVAVNAITPAGIQSFAIVPPGVVLSSQRCGLHVN
jgi:hypothetical protein